MAKNSRTISLQLNPSAAWGGTRTEQGTYPSYEQRKGVMAVALMQLPFREPLESTTRDGSLPLSPISKAEALLESIGLMQAAIHGKGSAFEKAAQKVAIVSLLVEDLYARIKFIE